MVKRLLLIVVVLSVVMALPAVVSAHHVGDKSIPGQDYQMDDDWLDVRAHRQAPWGYVGVGEDPTNRNKRCEHLADTPEFCAPNDNASLHETGEQFIHPDWPAFTGRFLPTEGGQQNGHQGPRASR